MVRLWVANTDHDWFDFLQLQSEVEEVNFWQPSGTSNFGAIQPGELFLFRLKSPRNSIGGFGVFSHASNLPISLAWEAFGQRNGAPNFAEMKQRVAKYRGQGAAAQVDFTIGCRIVVQPVFLPSSAWVAQPSSWSKSIVVGKAYDTDQAEGHDLWWSVQEAAKICGIGARAIARSPQSRRSGWPTGRVEHVSVGTPRTPQNKTH